MKDQQKQSRVPIPKKEKEKTHSSAWATASGSEAKATRGLNDVLMRILSVATAQDTKIITLRKRTVAEGR
jgi:hypothetical protein